MSATLLRDGMRGDIARSAHPYLVTYKGTGFYTSDGVFVNFGRESESLVTYAFPFGCRATRLAHVLGNIFYESDSELIAYADGSS